MQISKNHAEIIVKIIAIISAVLFAKNTARIIAEIIAIN